MKLALDRNPHLQMSRLVVTVVLHQFDVVADAIHDRAHLLGDGGIVASNGNVPHMYGVELRAVALLAAELLLRRNPAAQIDMAGQVGPALHLFAVAVRRRRGLLDGHGAGVVIRLKAGQQSRMDDAQLVHDTPRSHSLYSRSRAANSLTVHSAMFQAPPSSLASARSACSRSSLARLSSASLVLAPSVWRSRRSITLSTYASLLAMVSIASAAPRRTLSFSSDKNAAISVSSNT